MKLREGSGPGEWRHERRALGDDEAETERLSALVRERAAGFKLATGARLAFADGTPDIVAYPEDRAGWGRLCRLLTLGNRRARKGECLLSLGDLLSDARGLLLVVMPGRDRRGLPALLPRLDEAAPGALWLGATMPRRGDDRRRLAELAGIADRAGLPLVATNDALYADPGQRDLQDILTCIREGRTLETAGRPAGGKRRALPEEPGGDGPPLRRPPDAVAETTRLLAASASISASCATTIPTSRCRPAATRRAGWRS